MNLFMLHPTDKTMVMTVEKRLYHKQNLGGFEYVPLAINPAIIVGDRGKEFQSHQVTCFCLEGPTQNQSRQISSEIR